MIFLHGGMLCPIEIVAIVSAFPFIVYARHWFRQAKKDLAAWRKR